MHTITARRIKRLANVRKHGKTKARIKRDDEKLQFRQHGERRKYAGVLYEDGADTVAVLHPTKGWRVYNIENPIIGL